MIDIRRQSDIDSLLHIWYAFRVSQNRKAIRAARAMKEWHRDIRSEGRIAAVTRVATLLPMQRRVR